MTAWLSAILLGVVQGLTEFLPVSSSGHLVLAQAWLGDRFAFAEEAILFDLILHIGTLLPVLFFYRRDLYQIFKALLESPWRDDRGFEHWLRSNEHRWLAFLVCVALIPTGIIGLGLRDLLGQLFHNTTAVCIALCFTGTTLFITRFVRDDSARQQLPGVGIALLIGIAQGFAITPGISRSGSTIAVALLLGLNRDLAARFSFLLSIPTILGAMVMVLRDQVTFNQEMVLPAAAGFLASMITGYAALVMLVALVRRGGLHRFAYYVWPVALAGYLFLAR